MQIADQILERGNKALVMNIEAKVWRFPTVLPGDLAENKFMGVC